MIERLTVQREAIDYAANRIAELPGDVLELGLGKGRTYDRLRRVFPHREIHAFDRVVHCPADVRPPDSQLWLGDFRETLVRFRQRRGRCGALFHVDIGSDDRAADERLARDVSPLIEALLVTGALVLSDRALQLPRASNVDVPTLGVVWPYFVYQHSMTAR